jgi:hypothetical protein
MIALRDREAKTRRVAMLRTPKAVNAPPIPPSRAIHVSAHSKAAHVRGPERLGRGHLHHETRRALRGRTIYVHKLKIKGRKGKHDDD